MNPIYRSLLTRYQNYLLEFYQLIEDKEITEAKDFASANLVKIFFENLPEFSDAFEIEMQIQTSIGELNSFWLAQFNENGFSVRSYTLDGLDELEEWYFHYHDEIREQEGNLFTDGDWDLFLEEIAEIDSFGEKKITASFVYSV